MTNEQKQAIKAVTEIESVDIVLRVDLCRALEKAQTIDWQVAKQNKLASKSTF